MFVHLAFVNLDDNTHKHIEEEHVEDHDDKGVEQR